MEMRLTTTDLYLAYQSPIKMITGISAENLYNMLEESDILPMEQKGCRRKSRGTKDQILIDKMILNDCRM